MSPPTFYLDTEKNPSKFTFVEAFQINSMKCSCNAVSSPTHKPGE